MVEAYATVRQTAHRQAGTAGSEEAHSQDNRLRGEITLAYKLGKGSLRELTGVHPQLVAVFKCAITITEQDFTIHDGMRTRAEQQEYVRTGVSQTMNSKHLPQEDGFGHAGDLVPYINRRLRWEWPPIFLIAVAVRTAAQSLQVPVVWGGCWKRLDNCETSPEVMVAEYIALKQRQGRLPFPDGPHYELG